MLSFMAMDYFRQSPMLAMPILALAIFMLVFLVVTVRALVTKSARFDAVARLPLEQEARGREVRHD